MKKMDVTKSDVYSKKSENRLNNSRWCDAEDDNNQLYEDVASQFSVGGSIEIPTHAEIKELIDRLNYLWLYLGQGQ